MHIFKLLHLLRILSAAFLLALQACSSNVWSGLVSAKTDTALYEQARVEMDEEDYNAALATLARVRSDSNELRLLRSSATLGASGISLWSILTGIIDSDGYNSEQGNGVDNFFNLISANLLGEGEVRVGRLAALSGSIDDLLSAPDTAASRPKSLACLLAGMMALPAVTDATAAIEATTATLNSLAASVGTQNPDASCPEGSDLDSNLRSISAVQNQFTQIFRATADCKLLDITDTGASLNAIESQLAKFTIQADQGCSPSPACGSSAACQALGLSCVYNILQASSTDSPAGDSSISSCELVQNCLTPGTCF